MTRVLFDLWPKLRGVFPIAELGSFPTPVESLGPVLWELGLSGRDVFVKRDDLSSAVYGGNKVRALELLFGRARQQGKTRVYASGAYGSNHALATLLHAPRAGLSGGAILFPQPRTPSAIATLRALLSLEPELATVPHWSALPLGMALLEARALRAKMPSLIMPPGGATPRGVLGYVSAALELALQIQDGLLPAPRRVFVPTGSNGTCAGLLAGFALAAGLGIGFRSGPPEVAAIRIGPWPITSRARVLSLSLGTLSLLARSTREPKLLLGAREHVSRLSLAGEFLGRGYGYETDAANEACRVFEAAGLPILDETYSGKAAAALIAELRAGGGEPVLFWSTKSSCPLPPSKLEIPPSVPAPLRRWLEAAGAPG